MNGFKIKLVWGWPIFSGYYSMLASRRASYIQTINIWFPSTATLSVTSSQLQECHRRRCNVRRFGPGLCRDWRRESTNQNRVLKTNVFFSGRDLGREIPGCFRLLFRFSFFRLIVWVFFWQHGRLFIDSFLGWPFVLGDFWWLSLGRLGYWLLVHHFKTKHIAWNFGAWRKNKNPVYIWKLKISNPTKKAGR